MNRTEAREKATALVAQMTIEEAASQLLHSSPAIPRLGIPAYDWWSEALHGVTVNYYRKSPVPSLWKPGQNITLIPASETAPGTKV